MKAQPIVIQTSYREVFRQLEGAILRGELALDEPLPTEADLCEMFQVKRSTVREGIRLLEQSGLVKRTSARRLVVSAPGAALSSDSVIRSVTLNRVTLEELWEVERELEALAVRRACGSISPDCLAALEANVAETMSRRDDSKAVVRLDMDFHRLIAEASGNRALTMARDPLGVLLYASSDFVITRLAQSIDRLIAAHQRIFEAIAGNRPDEAATWMLKHMDDFKRGCVLAGANFDDPISNFVDPDVLVALTDHKGQ